jgi:nicotinate-nucleotide pyrophosphorylase (carboxylating)
MFESTLVRKLIDLALEEDSALHDITGEITVREGHRSLGRVVARQELVVCGLDIVKEIAQAGGWDLQIRRQREDGVVVRAEEPLIELSGSTREILAAERTILNFLQRLSGVATYTRDFCGDVSGITILDTRKTLPGWRSLDKYAVRIGGGSNHRASLSDMILVKNNHIDAHPGGMRGALTDAAAKRPLSLPWEVEVRSLEELTIALEFSPHIIMLDNFSDALLPDAVKLVRAAPGRILVEVSGGVSKARLEAIKGAGVDAVSVGALTTQAPNVDISMRVSNL